MAIIKRKELHEMSNEDLQKRLSELRLELSKERAQIAIGGSPKNTGRVSEVRKTIAKILTEFNLRKKISAEKNVQRLYKKEVVKNKNFGGV